MLAFRRWAWEDIKGTKEQEKVAQLLRADWGSQLSRIRTRRKRGELGLFLILMTRGEVSKLISSL